MPTTTPSSHKEEHAPHVDAGGTMEGMLPIRRRLARFLQRLAEPSTPRQAARVRINPRHPRSTAKATIRVAERARMRRAEQARPPEGRALRVWTAVGTVLAGVTAVPALFIALNALEISEQQATLAAQQLANRVTNITTYGSPSVIYESASRNTITIQNSNTVPVAVEGKVFLRNSREAETSATLTFTVPACTEADFSIDLATDGLAILPWSEFALHNTIDGRLWSVPAPGEQARIAETWLPWQQDHSKPRLDFKAPEKTRKVSACV